MGGSAARVAGSSPYTDGAEEGNSDAVGDGDGEKSDEDENGDCDDAECDAAGDDDHNELKVPHTFSPQTIFIVMTLGVLSDNSDPLLNHAID